MIRKTLVSASVLLTAALLVFALPVSAEAQLEISDYSEGYPEVGALTYGGPFSLVDHTGKAVTDQDYLGEYMLLTFGYTHCPDVCPTSLQNMANTLDLLGSVAESVRPIFVTIDPKRDTVEVLAGYVPLFHPRMVGLTGTPRQVHEAAAAYQAHYTTFEYQGEYLVDHTAQTYLTGPDGYFLKDFAYGTSAEDMAAEILHIVSDREVAANEAGQAPGSTHMSAPRDLHIEHPWARASIGAGKAGAAYLTIVNHGKEVERLLAAATPVAERAALHTHLMEEGVMKMRPLQAIEVAPGEPTVLEPGGIHIMLTGLQRPLTEGETFPLTLIFQAAGSIEVDVIVQKAGSMGHDHQMEHQHDQRMEHQKETIPIN
jgi:protein SCO1/2